MHNQFKRLAGISPMFLGLKVYLIFSLNFLGIFGHGRPLRRMEYKQKAPWPSGFPPEKTTTSFSTTFLRRSAQFIPSPQDQFVRQRSSQWSNPPSNGDTIDLSTVDVSGSLPASINRHDAFGEYDFIENRPPPRPKKPRWPSRTSRPQRQQVLNARIERPAAHRNTNYSNGPRWPSPPVKHVTRVTGHVNGHATRRPAGGSLASTFIQPPNQNSASPSGVFGSVLKLIRGSPPSQAETLEDYEYQTTELEEDYYDNSVIQQYNLRRKSVSERVADWFKGFQPDLKPTASNSQTKNGLDYNDYDAGDDFNLVFYNKTGPASAEFGFEDVLQSLRRNESSVVIMKKFLSAASALSERSGNNPVFMMWTIPTTIFAILGLLYLGGAILILTYKGLLFATGNTSDLVNVLPVAFSFGLPLILGLVLVGMKTYAVGQVSVARVMRGDIKNGFREDFDPIHFGLDSVFGASALLGLGWIVSIAI